MALSLERLSKNSKIKLISHNDLDGVGCGIVGKLAFDNLSTEYVGYDDIDSVLIDTVNLMDKSLSVYSYLIITDITALPSTMEYVNHKLGESRVILFDHHKSALEYNKYKWCNIQVKLNTDSLDCATHAFYRALSDAGHYEELSGLSKLKLSTFAEKVRRYDTWEWKNVYNDSKALKLNSLYWMLEQKEFVSEYVDAIRHTSSKPTRLMEGEWQDLIDSKYDILFKTKDKEYQKLLKNTQSSLLFDYALVDDVNYLYAFTFADRDISQLGNDLLDNLPHTDFVALLNPVNGKLSLRAKDNIDVSLVAKMFNGGGHKNASGGFMGRYINTAREDFQTVIMEKAKQRIEEEQKEENAFTGIWNRIKNVFKSDK